MRTLILAIALLAGCTTTPDPAADTPTDAWNWDLPEGFPKPYVPADNPMTAEKVALGRHLFFDTRLSSNEAVSCASCHDQAIGFADARPLSVGALGDLTPSNAPTLQNVAYYSNLTWAHPDILELEDQIAIPMFGEHPVEMGVTGNEALILGRLSDDPTYVDLWSAAWPDAPDPAFDTAIDALASFIRTMVSADSPFDRFVYAFDDGAMSDSALNGMDLFFSERFECHHCHGGFHLSRAARTSTSSLVEAAFDNNGLYNLDGEGGYPDLNQGLYAFTGLDSDEGRFRPPSLRNVAVTAPYMHDGSIETLQEVLAMYADGGLLTEDGTNAGDGRTNPHKSGFVEGFIATEQEFADLTAFLESLTDETFLFKTDFSDPRAE
jgi:cytochrome c peroxidase